LFSEIGHIEPPTRKAWGGGGRTQPHQTGVWGGKKKKQTGKELRSLNEVKEERRQHELEKKKSGKLAQQKKGNTQRYRRGREEGGRRDNPFLKLRTSPKWRWVTPLYLEKQKGKKEGQFL